MDCTSTRLPYRQTGAFQKTPLDYIDQSENLKPFFKHPPSLTGIQKAIEERKKFPTDRKVLQQVFEKQYEIVSPSQAVKKNIDSLLSPDTFTVTTAHQNNIFTGPLYFIYKILHAIRLSEHLNESFPNLHFVPVYYMGSEDADLEELNHIYLEGEKHVWETAQKGAVGRMKVDGKLLQLIDKMEGQLLVQPFGHEIISRLKECYRSGEDIQTATFRFVHTLFESYGLIIIIPDQSILKRQAVRIFENELLHQTASSIVEETAKNLEDAGYKVEIMQPTQTTRFSSKSGSWSMRGADFVGIADNPDFQGLVPEVFVVEDRTSITIKAISTNPNNDSTGATSLNNYWVRMRAYGYKLPVVKVDDQTIQRNDPRIVASVWVGNPLK